MEKKTKVETFLGFSIRAGKCRFGTNAIATLKKAYLIITCNTTSQNSLDKINKIAKKFGCIVLKTAKHTLSELTHKENAKVVAITDKTLANALLAVPKDELIQINQEISNG